MRRSMPWSGVAVKSRFPCAKCGGRSGESSIRPLDFRFVIEARRGPSLGAREVSMDFDYSPRQKEWMKRVGDFMERRVYPAEATYAAQMEEATQQGNRWIVVPVVEDLKKAAKEQGLWNLFLPHSEHGAGLTNLDYAPLAELM